MSTLITLTQSAQTTPSGIPYVVITLSGQIDESNLADVSAVLDTLPEGNAPRAVYLDIRDLTFINSKVIGYLVSVHTRLAEKDSEMYFIAPNQDILDIIDLVGLTQIVPVFDTLEAALSELR